jgi:hypothetical protein
MRSESLAADVATSQARTSELRNRVASLVSQASQKLDVPASSLYKLVDLAGQDLNDPEVLELVAARVEDMVEIVDRVCEWAGGRSSALAWYEGQPISGFGGKTPKLLVNQGKTAGLRLYLDHIAVGGFA